MSNEEEQKKIHDKAAEGEYDFALRSYYQLLDKAYGEVVDCDEKLHKDDNSAGLAHVNARYHYFCYTQLVYAMREYLREVRKLPNESVALFVDEKSAVFKVIDLANGWKHRHGVPSWMGVDFIIKISSSGSHLASPVYQETRGKGKLLQRQALMPIIRQSYQELIDHRREWGWIANPVHDETLGDGQVMRQ